MAKAEAKVLWRHYQPVRIVAGNGVLTRLPEVVAPGRILLVCSEGSVRRGFAERIMSLLGEFRVSLYDRVTSNPQLEDLDAAAESFRIDPVDAIVVIGGGSALDTGKVLSVLIPSNLPNCLDRIFRHGEDQVLDKRIPVVAIPTTSGTGAELTPFATIWDRQTNRKHSLACDAVYPESAILDPSLTLDVPRNHTLYTGLDTVSHALESLWNINRTPISEAFAAQTLKWFNGSFLGVLDEPENLEYRAGMQWASALAGLAISQTRTAIAHAISYPLTLRYEVPHGLACGFALPAIWEQCRSVGGETLDSTDIRRTIENLQKLDLIGELRKYMQSEKLFDIILPEMLETNRAGNYICDMDRANCGDIIARCIGGKKRRQ